MSDLPFARALFGIAAIHIVVGISLSWFGPIPGFLNELLCILLLVALGALALPGRPLWIAAFLGVAVVSAVVGLPPIGWALLPFLLLLVSPAGSTADGGYSRLLGACAVLTAVSVLYWLLQDNLPGVQVALHSLVSWVPRADAIHVPILGTPGLLAFSLGAGVVVFGGSVRANLLCAASCFLGGLAVATVTALVFLNGDRIADLPRLSILALRVPALAAMLPICAAFHRRTGTECRNFSGRIAIGACGVIAVVALFLSAPRRTAAEDVVCIALDEGLADHQAPSLESLGPYTGGMFSQLAGEFALLGARLQWVKYGDLFDRLDEHPDSLLLIVNPDRHFTERDLSVIHGHVTRGGGLLMLCDHTDVGSQMAPVNSLCAPYGISIRFDSSFPLLAGFESCLRARKGGIFEGVSPAVLMWDVGATIDVHSPGRSELVGQYSFSDHGVRGNFSGAALGNYWWQPDEELGDRTLIASAEAGKGRVVVCGDTTAFQNALIDTQLDGFLRPLLAWVAGTSVPRPESQVLLPTLLLAVVGAGLLVRRRSGRLRHVVLIMTVLAWVLGTSELADPPEGNSGLHLSESTAVMETSGRPLCETPGQMWTNIGTFGSLLTRTEWVPVHSDDLVHCTGTPGLIVVPAPIVPLQPSTVERIKDMVKAGSTCLICVDERTQCNAEGLRPDWGRWSVVGSNMGVVPFDRSALTLGPCFLEARRLVLDSSCPDRSWEPLYRYGDDVIVARARERNGCWVVIADPCYLQSRNLWGKGIVSRWGNVHFLQELLR